MYSLWIAFLHRSHSSELMELVELAMAGWALMAPAISQRRGCER
jgi:hypothetical protein